MDTSTSTGVDTGALAREATAPRLSRLGTLCVQGFVAVTAMAGGAALIIGSLSPDLAGILNPPGHYLDGTPFASYLVPGVLLAVVLGGIHAVGFLLGIRRSAWALLAAAAAAFAMLIWIFVQMIFIPFSFLQAVYFAAGLIETGLVMLSLGILRSTR